MPSKFIVEQSELLYRSNDPETVLENIRERYAQPSFPSQMSRVKEEWTRFNDRDPHFPEAYEKGLLRLQDCDMPKNALKEYKRFGRDE